MNVLIVKGNLGKDPELRATQNGTAVANASLAINEGYGEKQTTLWLGLVAWKKTAEFLAKHFHKGSAILVEGRLQVREYETREGEKRQAVEVVANRIHFADGKKQESGVRSQEPEERNEQPQAAEGSAGQPADDSGGWMDQRNADVTDSDCAF